MDATSPCGSTGDPVTGTAEYKVCAAEVRLLEARQDSLMPGSDYKIDGPGVTYAQRHRNAGGRLRAAKRRPR